MAVFTAYTNDQIINFLKEKAPHADIHIDDKIAAEHTANGKA